MPFKKHKPEENIGKLREVEIVLAQGGIDCRSVSADRGQRADLLPLAQGIWWPEDGQVRPTAAASLHSYAGAGAVHAITSAMVSAASSLIPAAAEMGEAGVFSSKLWAPLPQPPWLGLDG